jgi:hypothetical protein
MKIVILLFSTCWCLNVFAQTPAVATSVKTLTQVEHIGELTGRHFFMFATESRKYTVRQDGHGESYATNVWRKNFDLKTGPGGRIARLYFVERGPDVLLLYEVTDGRAGWAYMTLLDQKTAKPKWWAPVRAINVGVSMVEGDSAYVAAENFVARIDLVSGKFAWQLTDFGQNQTPEFKLTELTSNRVVLREDSGEGREVEIDKQTGQVMNQRVKVRN